MLWDNLTALQPATIKEAQTALFLRKMLRHISALINTRSFDTTEEMIQRCNALWMSETPEEAASAAAAAGSWQHSTLRNACRSPSPYRRKTPDGDKSGDKSGRRHSPTPWDSQGRPQRRSVFLPLPLRQQGPQVREGLHLPGKLIGRWPAHSLPPPQVLFQPAAPPLLQYRN